MGGDDLGDDDNLWIQPLRGNPKLEEDSGDDHDDGNQSNNDDEDNNFVDTWDNQPLIPALSSPHNKRRSGSIAGKDDNVNNSNTKKRKTMSSSSPAQLLLEVGKDLPNQDAVQCATFLATAIQHYTMLSTKNDDGNTDTDATQRPLSEETMSNLKQILLPRCVGKLTNAAVVTSKNMEPSDIPETMTILECIRSNVSIKKLKQWKVYGNPSVIIVCLSARRAVSILHDLSTLKVRVAKWFPKNGSVQEQQEQMASAPYSIAVGTPHRLCQLLCKEADGSFSRKQAQQPPTQRQLSLAQTQLLIFDCFVSHKQYTVCTLPDTAPHCMALIRDGLVGPMLSSSATAQKSNQANKKKNSRSSANASICKIAFV